MKKTKTESTHQKDKHCWILHGSPDTQMGLVYSTLQMCGGGGGDTVAHVDRVQRTYKMQERDSFRKLFYPMDKT